MHLVCKNTKGAKGVHELKFYHVLKISGQLRSLATLMVVSVVFWLVSVAALAEKWLKNHILVVQTCKN